jgi:N6-L-threonylcarbamoyladenine synthase
MKILSIETSCDETGISIIEAKGGINNASFKVLGNNVASQIETHIPYGGVFPALAKREHIKNLPIVLEKTLKEAKMLNDKKPVDLIAVTSGPGLEPALWTGIVFAKELSKKWKVPVIPVNHMEGHILSVFGKNKGGFKITKTKNPTLSLLVSGGHTELVLVNKWMDYKIIGQTLDDAVGEAFDKVARMLGLPYPGGPQISRLAENLRNKVQENRIILPRPMLYSKNFDFSFSGLKTAVLYLIRKIGPLDEKTKSEIALEFENAAIECLTHKTKKAIEKFKINTIIVAGGVAANKHLRNEMKKIKGKKVKLFFPEKDLATDNSLMIGITGYINYIKKKKKVPRLSSIKAAGNLRL